MATLTSEYQYVGRSNAVSCPSGWNYYILLYAKTSGNNSTGKHSVTVKQRLVCDQVSTFYGWCTSGYAKVAGENAFSWSWSHVPDAAWNTSSITAGSYTYPRWIDLKEGTVVVNTGYGETQDITLESSWVMEESNSAGWFPYTGKTAKSSFTVTLPMIAGASVPTLSASSVVMLNKVKITTNRQSSSLTHDLTYSFGGITGTIATGVGDSYEWTVPDLVAKIAGKTSEICTIICKTKSGSTEVGSETVTLTLKVPAKSTPSASASTVKMGTSVSIYTNRKSTGFSHTLIFEIGDISETIATAVEGSAVWTPPKSLAAHTGNQTSVVCTITCNTYTGDALVGTSTTQITLTVPDATVPSLSESSIVLGNPIVIYTPRETECYEHWITYTLKADGSSTVVLTKDFTEPIQESYEWTPSVDLIAAAIPSATKGIITITCKTRFKDSSELIGTADPIAFAVTIPDNSTTKPEFTMAVSPVHNLASAFDGIYVAGKTKVRVTYTAESDYSTIKSYLTTVNGKSGNGNPYTSDVLGDRGAVTITGRVTDSRGYTTVKTESIEVISYGRPRIVPASNQSSIVCKRCNSDGTPDPGGEYLLIKVGRKYSKVVSNGSQKNYCKISYRYKTDAQEESAYSNPVELLSRTATGDYVSKVLSGIVSSNTTAYNIQLIAEDDVGEMDAVTITIPTAFATAHVPDGGHGFTLGGYHDPAKVDVFDCRFDAEFQGNVTGQLIGLGKMPEIPEGSDFNNYKEFGVYSVRKNDIAKTLINCPSVLGGTLRVWSANGSGVNSGEGTDIMQEYICYNNTGTWRRHIQFLSLNGSWVYGVWRRIEAYEDGTTDGWYWRKHSDGTAECWRSVSNAKRDITTAFGNMYYANCDDVAFPFSFHSAPVVNVTVESSVALILMSGAGITTVNKPASYRVMHPTLATGVTFTIAYHVIGRWKE